MERRGSSYPVLPVEEVRESGKNGSPRGMLGEHDDPADRLRFVNPRNATTRKRRSADYWRRARRAPLDGVRGRRERRRCKKSIGNFRCGSCPLSAAISSLHFPDSLCRHGLHIDAEREEILVAAPDL